MLQFIDKNINRIIENPDSVMYLRLYSVKNKVALFAVIKEEDGVYKKIQISKEKFKGNFPLEPIFYFYPGPGYFYLKNFIVFDNWLALNVTNLDGFKYSILDDNKIFKVGVFATFNDDSAIRVTEYTIKGFEKKVEYKHT